MIERNKHGRPKEKAGFTIEKFAQVIANGLRGKSAIPDGLRGIQLAIYCQQLEDEIERMKK